jgi:hypothetical protein
MVSNCIKDLLLPDYTDAENGIPKQIVVSRE